MKKITISIRYICYYLQVCGIIVSFISDLNIPFMRKDFFLTTIYCILICKCALVEQCLRTLRLYLFHPCNLKINAIRYHIKISKVSYVIMILHLPQNYVFPRKLSLQTLSLVVGFSIIQNLNIYVTL